MSYDYSPLSGELHGFNSIREQCRAFNGLGALQEQLHRFGTINQFTAIGASHAGILAGANGIRAVDDLDRITGDLMAEATGASQIARIHEEFFERTRPELPDVTGTLQLRTYLEDARREHLTDAFRAFTPPLPPAPPLWDLPAETDDAYMHRLLWSGEALEAEDETLAAENEALKAENESLQHTVRELKLRLRYRALQNTVEYTDPDVPPADSLFNDN